MAILATARRPLALLAAISVLTAADSAPAGIRALLLSGQNNHDWPRTTPQIERLLEETGRLAVDVEGQPERLTAARLAPYGVIVSNWNSWGADAQRVVVWPEETRAAYLEFVRRGGGHVVVHAGSSSFYDWPEYHELALAAWNLAQTGHGRRHRFTVTIQDLEHPITRGLAPFDLEGELWHRPGVRPGASVLATAYSDPALGGSGGDEPVALVGEFGRGRCFTLLLGHDAQEMENPGFVALLIRGAEWAATGEVSAGEAGPEPPSATIARWRMIRSAQLTRRDALRRGGAAAAAAVAAPTIIPSSALGDETTAPPSERVTLGHIGLGERGAFLLESIRGQRDVDSLAAADCYADRREAAAASMGGAAYADFRRLLDRHDVDGVVIATPDHWHVPIALLAAEAGKDVYVEKPLGLSLEQDLLCQRVMTERGRVFQYGTQQREAKHLQAGRVLVRSGRLGKLRAIEVAAPNGGVGGSTAEAPVPAGFDYAMWLGPAPAAPYTADRCRPPGTYWIYDHSIGYLAGWGAHPLDILAWCYDGDQAGPFTVEGTGRIPVEGLYNAVYDWQMRLGMVDGVRIKFTTGSDSTKFIGAEGRAELTRNSLRTYPPDLRPNDLPANDDIANATRHLQSFAAAIRTRQAPSSPIDDAVRSDVISQLCDIAVRTGERITWDPARREIVGGSPAAQAMARRPQRDDWRG